jgi:hypothetical protein
MAALVSRVAVLKRVSGRANARYHTGFFISAPWRDLHCLRDSHDPPSSAGESWETGGFLLVFFESPHAKREIPLAKGENLIGRDRNATARIDDSTISRRHARILVAEKGP